MSDDLTTDEPEDTVAPLPQTPTGSFRRANGSSSGSTTASPRARRASVAIGASSAFAGAGGSPKSSPLVHRRRASAAAEVPLEGSGNAVVAMGKNLAAFRANINDGMSARLDDLLSSLLPLATSAADDALPSSASDAFKAGLSAVGQTALEGISRFVGEIAEKLSDADISEHRACFPARPTPILSQLPNNATEGDPMLSEQPNA
jgi:hypothetical protein